MIIVRSVDRTRFSRGTGHASTGHRGSDSSRLRRFALRPGAVHQRHADRGAGDQGWPRHPDSAPDGVHGDARRGRCHRRRRRAGRGARDPRNRFVTPGQHRANRARHRALGRQRLRPRCGGRRHALSRGKAHRFRVRTDRTCRSSRRRHSSIWPSATEPFDRPPIAAIRRQGWHRRRRRRKAASGRGPEPRSASRPAPGTP